VVTEGLATNRPRRRKGTPSAISTRCHPERSIFSGAEGSAVVSAVPWHSTRPGKEPLVINVEGGGRYCVRLYAKMINFEVIPYEHLNSQIEEFPCQLAQSEAADMNPIEIK
jgi:hypothetical protein